MKNNLHLHPLMRIIGCLLLCIPAIAVVAQENQPPVADCSYDYYVYLDDYGQVIIDANEFGRFSYDPDGDQITKVLDRNIFTCADIGEITVTLTVTDPEGASDFCTKTIKIVDEVPPVAQCVSEVSAYLDAEGEATVTIDEINDGSYDNCDDVFMSISDNVFGCSSLDGHLLVATLSVRDAVGNEEYCYTKVNLFDMIPPKAECPNWDIDVKLDRWGYGDINVFDVDLGSDDNCGIESRELSQQVFGCQDVGTKLVYLTVKDASLNSSTCSFNVNVIDEFLPVFYCNSLDLPLDPVNGEAEIENLEDLVDFWDPDNCGELIITIDPPQTSFNCDDIGIKDLTVTVTDVNGNSDFCHTTVRVHDPAIPEIQCEPYITVVSDPYFCGLEIDDVYPKPVVTDNCGPVTLSNDVFTYLEIGDNPVEWTATDPSDNHNHCHQTIHVIDATPPIITCKPGLELTTDPGSCFATISEADLEKAIATDNCFVVNITSNFADKFPEGKVPFGEHCVYWTAVDPSGNSAICCQTINVNKVQTITAVTVTPAVQQYSDPVTLKATIDPGWCVEAGQAATHVTFYINLQPMGPPVELELVGDLLVAEATYNLLELPGYEGSMEPSAVPKMVKASFSGLNDNFIVDNPNTGLTITPENACASYAGVLFASTAGANSSQAVVTLAATVIEEADGHTNDLLNYSTLQFYNGITPIGPPLQLGWITEGDKTMGTAMYEWPVDLGQSNGTTYSISAEVTGYYANAPGDCWAASEVTVSKPLGEFITGGGNLLLENSAGIKAGDAGTKNSFGFNVKFTKKLTSLQGNINTTFRRTENGKTKVFNAKGTAFTSLAVVNNYAVFTGKAVIKNITDPLYPFDEEGNATMQMSMTDNGDGTLDLLGITLWNKKGGLWFSSNWSGTKTIDKLLAAGNLVIHKSPLKSGEVAEFGIDGNSPDLKVYPNPFSKTLRFEFVSPAAADARIDLYDVTGRLVKTIFEEPIEGGVSYEAEFSPEAEVSAMYIYRMVIGNMVYNGKATFKKE